MMFVGLILLALVAYYMFNSANPRGSCYMHYQPRENTALDLLNERYARGEINREEYLERKQELSR